MITVNSLIQLINGLFYGIKESAINTSLINFCLFAFIGIFTNMLGHVLFIERSMATIYACSYETNGKHVLFNITWITILVCAKTFSYKLNWLNRF